MLDLLKSSTMGRLILAQLEIAARDDPRIDLTILWREAGRPRGRSPRQWLWGMISDPERFEDRGGGPDGPLLADLDVALFYASHWLDPTCSLKDAFLKLYRIGAHNNCGPMLVHEGAGPLGLLAKLGIIHEGWDEATAERHLLGQV